jgi:hypothetical protein
MKITNEQLARARKMVEAERKILAALYRVKPEKREAVLRAAAILQGVEL